MSASHIICISGSSAACARAAAEAAESGVAIASESGSDGALVIWLVIMYLSVRKCDLALDDVCVVSVKLEQRVASAEIF